MSLINVNNLTFAYPGSYDNIFENASFQIDTNWKLGFTGRNGRGKTTFLNLLQGKYEYTGVISSSVAFEYFPFAVMDNKYTYEMVEDICTDYEHWQLIREFNFLKIEEEVLYRPFGTLSNGEQTKVMLAALFIKENTFLLIDEPTNHLDMLGRQIVGEYLKKKAGFILVSHDRSLLDDCVDHILSINKASIEIEKGNFSSWFLNKERRDQFEIAENDKLKKEVKRLQDTAKEKAKWSDNAESKKIGFDPTKVEKNIGRRPAQGAKAKKAMKRAKALEHRQELAIEEKSKLLKNIESSENLKIMTQDFHTKTLVRLNNVSIYYGDNQVCENISFEIQAGDRISLSGTNGCGKSSIIKLICGEKIPYEGELQIGSGLKISYVSQDTSNLSGNLSDYAKEYDLDESIFKALLRKLDFERVQFEKDISDFSSGQKKKVLIARSLCEKAHFLVWDEPLNYIDIISRMQIENMLLEYKPTILFVEHDKVFHDTIASNVIKM